MSGQLRKRPREQTESDDDSNDDVRSDRHQQKAHVPPRKAKRTTREKNDETNGGSSNQKRRHEGDINERNILPNKRRPTSKNTAEERRDREKNKQDTRKQRELNKQVEADRKRRKREKPRTKYIEKRGARSGALHRLIVIGPRTVENITRKHGQLGEKRRTRRKKGRAPGVFDDGG